MSSTMNKDVGELCKLVLTAEKIEHLRNRPEKSPAERFKENHALSEELKKHIVTLSQIRKSETIDARLDKIDAALVTMHAVTKPLKKALSTALFSTDTQLLELAVLTARETLFEIGSSAAIDPVEAGKKVAEALKQASVTAGHYVPDKSEWCSEWIVDEDMDDLNELYNDIYKDSNIPEDDRFIARFGLFHRYNREFFMFSKGAATGKTINFDEEDFISPAVYPFNVDSDFMLQLVDVERVEKQKKLREKVEKGSKKKAPTAELVKVNDKASNVQCEEVSISNELKHVLKMFRKELKTRKTDRISYYEFVTNHTSFSRTVENMFYVSYLMRDREVFMIEEDNVPMLARPTFANENQKKQAELHNTFHGVTALSFVQWKRLSKAFNRSIIEPLDA